MNLFNRLGYSPHKNIDPASGFCRHPRDAACVVDYFAALSYLEDEGRFSHHEMLLLMKFPEKFFTGLQEKPE